MTTTRKYTVSVRDALLISRPWIYEGKAGALRLAREYGAALSESPKKEAELEMTNARSYNDICVIGYNFQPPLDAKEWQEEVKSAYEYANKKMETVVTL